LEEEEDMSFTWAIQEHQSLEHITTLELALNTKESNVGGRIDCTKLGFLSHRLPNVSHLVLNRVPTADTHLLFRLFPNVHQVAWSGGILQLSGVGVGFLLAQSLTELMLDGCHLVFNVSGNMDNHREALLNEFSNNALGTDIYIFEACGNLERLSMKNATWSTSCSERALPAESIPQEMLVKMVRCHPRLRWLKSDLTQENVTMLQQEKPEITFVTE